MMKAAVAAGGFAWVAPSVLSLDRAFAVGSCCTPGSVNLLAAPFGNGTNVLTGSFNTGLGSTMTFTATSQNQITNTTCAPTTWTTGRVTNCQAGAISTGQIAIIRRGDRNTPVSLTMTFSTPVRNLTFTLTDIDSSTQTAAPYQEQVTIAWTQGTGTSTPTYTPGTGLTAVSANVYRATSTTFNAGAADPSCNLGVDFGCGGTIKTVTITSADLNSALGTDSTVGRMIGLAQLGFCV